MYLREMVLYLTQRCNLKCVMCDAAYTATDTQADEIDFHSVKTLIENQRPQSVTLLGMEPLLYGHISELLRFLQTRSLYVYLGTNGYFIIKYLQEILECVNTINISLDSHDPDIHDQIRQKKGAFERTLDGIKALTQNRNSKKPIITVLCVITDKNYRDLEHLCRFLELLDIDILRFNFPRYLSREQAEEQVKISERLGLSWPLTRITPPASEFIEIDTDHLSDSLRRIQKYPFTIIHGPESESEIKNYFSRTPVMPEHKCLAQDTLSIFPAGDTVLCHDFPDISLGNAFGGAFWQTLDFTKARALKRGGIFPACVRCTKYYPSYGPGLTKWKTLLTDILDDKIAYPVIS